MNFSVDAKLIAGSIVVGGLLLSLSIYTKKTEFASCVEIAERAYLTASNDISRKNEMAIVAVRTCSGITR